MKRDMDLCRKILFAIEEQYQDSTIVNLDIKGYNMAQVAYNCRLLEDAGFLEDYSTHYGSNEMDAFFIGPLTWEGHEFLDKIRKDTVWHKTKETIIKKGLPMILDSIRDISTAIIASATEGAVRAIIKGGE